MKNMKRNIVVVVVLLFVCLAVYLNWSYNNKWGKADDAMSQTLDDKISAAEDEYTATQGQTEASEDVQETVSGYFAEARLTRQKSRDEAIGLLESASTAETASQEVIDGALAEISCMAAWSMQEAQIENLLIAKEFADCVVFISDDCVTVAVPAPVDGLSEAAVARITDTITTESDFTADQIKIIEVKEE